MTIPWVAWPRMAPITVKLPDGSPLELDDGATGADAAAAIGPRLAKDALAVRVNGEVRDLAAPLANGEEIDIDTLQRVSNTLRRLLESIGLKRQAVDRTPSLSEYLARRDAAKAAATKEATHE